MKISFRTMTTVMVLIVIGVLAVLGAEHAHAAKKYKLPDKVVTYYADENGEWEKYWATQYTYDGKVNLLKKKETFCYDDENSSYTTKYKNTYKKGKLVKVKSDGQVRTYNSKGRCTKNIFGKQVTKFKTNKNGYITKATGEWKYSSTVKYQSNGMPSQITLKYKNNHIDKIIAKFNADGTIKYLKEKYGKEYNEYKYTYEATDNGFSVIGQSRENGEGEYVDSSKYVYTIGSKKTKDKRKYVSMMGSCINYQLMSGVMPEHLFVLGNG